MISKLDALVANFVNSIYVNTNGKITPILKFITTLGNAGIIFIIAVLLLIIFKRSRKTGFFVAITLIVSILICYILKVFVSRPRPYTNTNSIYYKFWLETGQIVEKSFSFPSGHTTCASAFGFALFFSCKKKYRYLFILIPLLMGFTRIYFSVHYFSDCFVGFTIGFITSLSIYIVIKRLNKRKLEPFED